MRMSGVRPLLVECCWNFCKALTKPAPSWDNGTARPWSGRRSKLLLKLPKIKGDRHGEPLYTSEASEGVEHRQKLLRRMREDQRYLGPVADVYRMRTRWLLRFLQKSARHKAFQGHPASGHPLRRTGRYMDVVLCGPAIRRDSRIIQVGIDMEK